MGIFETFKHSYLIRDLMLFLIVQLFVQLEIWSIVSLFNYFCSIVVCSIVELFYWLLWSKFFVQLTFVESVFCSIVLFNWSCSIWSRSTDMEGLIHGILDAQISAFLGYKWWKPIQCEVSRLQTTPTKQFLAKNDGLHHFRHPRVHRASHHCTHKCLCGFTFPFPFALPFGFAIGQGCARERLLRGHLQIRPRRGQRYMEGGWCIVILRMQYWVRK